MQAVEQEMLQPDMFGGAPTPVVAKPKPALHDAFRGALKPDMIRVSPTDWVWRPTDASRVPTYGLLKWHPVGDGTYKPVPICQRCMVVSRELLDAIGFRGWNKSLGDATLTRLAIADEIALFNIAPRCRMIDIDSWYRYLDDCMTNPDKWEPGSSSYDNYMFRNALGRFRGKKRAPRQMARQVRKQAVLKRGSRK